MGLGALFSAAARRRGGRVDRRGARRQPDHATLACRSDAAQLLVDKDITGALVVDEGAFVGVLSQFDFLYKTAGSRSGLTAGTTSSVAPRWRCRRATS